MSITKKFQLIIFLLLITLLISGCTISFKTTSQSTTDGGVFKSADNGKRWSQTVLVPTISGKPQSFNFANILSLAIDPQDHNAVYTGTEQDSMFYTYDGGQNWFLAKGLGKREVRDIAVSPLYKCNIYVASENKIFKSTDCNRNWEQIYYDNEPAVRINSLAIDPNNAAFIYAGTSRGELIGSTDYGQSWTTIKRFEYEKKKKTNPPVIKVVVNKKNPNNIFVASADDGVYKTNDKGKSWVDFKEEFLEFDTKNALKVNDIAIAESDGKTVIVATKAGMVRSYDLGAHWHLVDLIPPADKAYINALAFNPKNKDEIYYATNTTFGWSKDGGKTWTSKKLPSTRTGSALVVDFEKLGTVYLGVRLVGK